jgi:hypothetical protein
MQESGISIMVRNPDELLRPEANESKAPSVDEATLSIRLKHGIHTIFLFVDSLAPFSEVTNSLLDILRERYPAGLTTTIDPPKSTQVPTSEDEVQIAYASLVNQHDVSKGWKELRIKEDDTPGTLGIKDGSILAFTFRPADDADEEAVFLVEWPKLDDDYEEAEEP